MDSAWGESSPWNDDAADTPVTPVADPWAADSQSSPVEDGENGLNLGFSSLSTYAAATSTPWDQTSTDVQAITPIHDPTEDAIPQTESSLGEVLPSTQGDPWAAAAETDSWQPTSTVSPDTPGWTAEDDAWTETSRRQLSADDYTESTAWPSSTVPATMTRGPVMDREQMDTLKIEARDLIETVHTGADGFQSSFSTRFESAEGFGDMFGSSGDKRELVARLDTPPATLLATDGVSLNLGAASAFWERSPVTQQRLRLAVQTTENKTVKLTAPETAASSSWLRSSEASRQASTSMTSRASMDAKRSSVEMSSGPGWTQTSASDATSAKSVAGSFIASLFKNKQPAATHMRKTSSAHSSTRNSQDMAAASPVMDNITSVGAYRDDVSTSNNHLRYSDDPTGPDLMSLDQPATKPTTSPPPSAATSSFLGRWRSSGIFNKAAPPPTDNGESDAGLGWTKSFSGTKLGKSLIEADNGTRESYYDDDALTHSGRYDDSDGYEGYKDQPRAPVSAAKKDVFEDFWESQPPLQSTATAHVDSFDLFASPSTSLNPVPSKPRQATPLPPPPRSTNTIASASSAVYQDLLFDDFESPSAAKQQAAKAPQQLAKLPIPAASHSKTGSGALTADDLLFFDNL